MNISNFTTKDIERFWTRVSKSDDFDSCWEWTGTKDKDGYGKLSIGGRKVNGGKIYTAHRLSWMLNYGVIPNGLWVLHRCDNPCCCNPKHLFLGTVKDNVDDMRAKGRQYDLESNVGKIIH